MLDPAGATRRDVEGPDRAPRHPQPPRPPGPCARLTTAVLLTGRRAGDRPPDGSRSVGTPVPRRWLAQEVWLVFGLSIGAAALRSTLSFVASLTAGSLPAQVAVLNASRAPGRPGLDLVLQLIALVVATVPVLLAGHLLARSGEGTAPLVGAAGRRPLRDLVRGVALAAVVGGSGLAFYLAVHAAGLDLTVVPEALPAVWWRVPVLLLSAVQNALLEEVLLSGYLLHRLGRLGWRPGRALALSAVLRGGYHLYQGLGGFAGNVVMGLLFGRLYQRWGRVQPLVVAHALIDAVAFVGFAVLAGHVSWLPTPVG